MNIKQKIKELFHDSKKRNIVISCAAAIVILAVGIPVGFSIYGNNASPVTMAVASHQENGQEGSSASPSRNSISKASSDKDSSSKSEKDSNSSKADSDGKNDKNSSSSSKDSSQSGDKSSKSGTSSSPAKPSGSDNSASHRPSNSQPDSPSGNNGNNGGGNKPVNSDSPTPAPDPEPAPEPEPEPTPEPEPQPEPETRFRRILSWLSVRALSKLEKPTLLTAAFSPGPFMAFMIATVQRLTSLPPQRPITSKASPSPWAIIITRN